LAVVRAEDCRETYVSRTYRDTDGHSEPSRAAGAECRPRRASGAAGKCGGAATAGRGRD